MSLLRRIAPPLALCLLVGCSTTQEITLAKSGPIKPITSVAQVAEDGNSAPMDSNLAGALQKEGLTVRPSLPKGTRSASDVDALISYVDVWRWDIVMYMKDLTVRLHDARSGDLLAMGQWSDSALHGFRDAKAVMESLVSELMAKVRDSKPGSAAK